MKKILIITTALLMAVACTANDERNNSWSKGVVGDVVTTNVESGEAYTDNAIVIVEMKDITKPYINLSIEGVKFVAMMPDVNFLVSNIPFKLYASEDKNDPLYGSWTFNEKSIVPTVGGVAREEYTMHNFIGSISDYGVVIDFDVNFGGVVYHATFGKNDALQTWEATYTTSATVTLNPGESSTSYTDDITLTISQANLSKQVADITFKDFRFAPQMPEITMTLTDVPFVFSDDGTQRLFNVASIVPKVGDKQYPQYTMSDITGSATNKSLILNFEIESMNAKVILSGNIN